MFKRGPDSPDSISFILISFFKNTEIIKVMNIKNINKELYVLLVFYLKIIEFGVISVIDFKYNLNNFVFFNCLLDCLFILIY